VPVTVTGFEEELLNDTGPDDTLRENEPPSGVTLALRVMDVLKPLGVNPLNHQRFALGVMLLITGFEVMSPKGSAVASGHSCLGSFLM
jgi:hypothetical protein